MLFGNEFIFSTTNQSKCWRHFVTPPYKLILNDVSKCCEQFDMGNMALLK